MCDLSPQREKFLLVRAALKGTMNAGEFERRQVPSLSQLPELSDTRSRRIILRTQGTSPAGRAPPPVRGDAVDPAKIAGRNIHFSSNMLSSLRSVPRQIGGRKWQIQRQHSCSTEVSPYLPQAVGRTAATRLSSRESSQICPSYFLSESATRRSLRQRPQRHLLLSNRNAVYSLLETKRGTQ